MKVIINTPFYQQYFYHIPARYVYEIGGRWSSKTFSVIQINVKEALENKGLVIAGCRKVYATIKDTLYSDFLVVMKLYGLVEGKHYRATVSPLEINFYNGSKVIFKGMDKADKAKGLSGVHRLILEEVNEFSEMDYETLDMSIRGTGYPLITYLMHNPLPIVPGESYWFQKLFDPGDLKLGVPRKFYSEGLGAEITALRTTYKHNKFVPKGVVRRLEGYKLTNPDLYKLWALGEYTQVQGAIYTNWDIVDRVPDGIELLGYGLDFGYSNDPAACLKIWGNKDEIWIKGIIYKTGLTNRDLINELTKHGIGRYDKIVADSAEPKSIEEIFRQGFSHIKGVKKRANYKTDIINVLRGYKIHVLSGDIDLHREISTYAWQKDKNDKPLPKPQDGNDHYMDCLSMFWHEYKMTRITSVPDVGLY
jgi:phage terminase large subunit